MVWRYTWNIWSHWRRKKVGWIGGAWTHCHTGGGRHTGTQNSQSWYVQFPLIYTGTKTTSQGTEGNEKDTTRKIIGNESWGGVVFLERNDNTSKRYLQQIWDLLESQKKESRTLTKTIPSLNSWRKKVRNIRVWWALSCPVDFQRTHMCDIFHGT